MSQKLIISGASAYSSLGPQPLPSTTPSPPLQPSYWLPLPLLINPVLPQHQHHSAISRTFSSSAAFISVSSSALNQACSSWVLNHAPLPYSDGCLHLGFLFSSQSSLFLLGPQPRLIFHNQRSHEQPTWHEQETKAILLSTEAEWPH
jgi:hypothetical protein